jgi:hypothetical protein
VRRPIRVHALCLLLAIACASPAPPPGPRLTLVAGRPAEDPIPPDCELAEWAAPGRKPNRICIESSAAVEITPRDVKGFRIEDQHVNDQRWYFVSVVLERESRNRIWKLLEAPDASDADDDRPYAILVDGTPSIVQPAIGIGQFDALVATTQDLLRAEAIANGWGVPVTRVISAEIESQPILTVSMVQLIANPAAWIGKRVSVQGFLPSTALGLYLSREHAESLDHASSIDLIQPATDAEAAEALSVCEGKWVLIEAFVDSDGGLPRLTRVERLAPFPNGLPCWPPRPAKLRPRY